jgi:hypothetical protein
MNIEHLSKSQLLLLTLLVSFVTSTATGVLTVSLLEETPQTVTQTVNRVVERTIERVEQSEAGAAVITRETTVVVKEEDIVGDSVQVHAGRIVSLYVGTTTSPVIATGLFLPKQGLVATAKDGLKEGKILIKFAGGAIFPAELAIKNENGVAHIKPILAEGEKLPVITPYEFAKAEDVRRGQSIFALTTRGAVETGIISIVNGEKVETNLVQSLLPYGTTLISTLGDIIGMHVAVAENSGAQFISAKEILGAVDAYVSSQVKEEKNATI